MKRPDLFAIILLGFVVLVVNGCAASMPGEVTATVLPAASVSLPSQIVASSIPELTRLADIVVIGRVVSEEKVINTARDPRDLSRPDARIYSLNQVYTVEVERVIQGEELTRLLLVQNQGSLALTPATTPSLPEIEGEIQRNAQKTYIPLSFGKRYLFFLRVLDRANYDLDGYKPSELYAGAAEPWRFEITGAGMVIPETLLPGLEKIFPSRDLDAVLEAVSQSDPTGTPYPGPTIQEQPGQTPYP